MALVYRLFRRSRVSVAYYDEAYARLRLTGAIVEAPALVPAYRRAA